MIYAVLLASSALAVVLVLALVREVRLRRALQRLLAKLLSLWRNQNEDDRSSEPAARANDHARDWDGLQ